MPLYEYRCQKCKHAFEKLQKFSDKPQAKCPKCGGRGKRQLSAPAIQFKGSGWYVTDYGPKSKHKKDKGEPSGGKEKAAEKKEKTKSDSGSKKD